MGSFQTYNPSTIIRTVNHLQPLKKERVIEILDEYTHVAPGESYPLLSNSELGGYCQTKLRSIMSVLFVPRAPEQGIPQRPKGSFFPYAISSEWPQSLVALSGGIPFQTIQIGVRTGEPIGSCRFLLDWARDNCDLRESPLVPTHQPRVAAKELIEKHNIRYPQAWNKLKAADLEVQIQNMLKYIDQPCNNSRGIQTNNNTLGSSSSRKLSLTMAISMRYASVRWDTVKQNYVNVDSDR